MPAFDLGLVDGNVWSAASVDAIEAAINGLKNVTDTDLIAALDSRQAPTAWTNATLINGWASYGGGYIGAQYRKAGDMVQIRGMIRSGGVGALAFTLPAGFCPPATVQFLSPTGGGWEVGFSGGFYIFTGTSTAALPINCEFSTSA